VDFQLLKRTRERCVRCLLRRQVCAEAVLGQRRWQAFFSVAPRLRFHLHCDVFVRGSCGRGSPGRSWAYQFCNLNIFALLAKTVDKSPNLNVMLSERQSINANMHEKLASNVERLSLPVAYFFKLSKALKSVCNKLYLFLCSWFDACVLLRLGLKALCIWFRSFIVYFVCKACLLFKQWCSLQLLLFFILVKLFKQHVATACNLITMSLLVCI